MQIPTHILAGWIIGNATTQTKRARLACVFMATIPDVDGLGLLWSRELYFEYHHHVGHSIVLGGLLSLLLSFALGERWRLCIPLSLCFASHLVMDSFGSGHGWGLALFWPVSSRHYTNPYAWDFSGWQNALTLFVVIGLTIEIFRRARRTPFEMLAPPLDRRICSWCSKSSADHHIKG